MKIRDSHTFINKYLRDCWAVGTVLSMDTHDSSSWPVSWRREGIKTTPRNITQYNKWWEGKAQGV